jgi:hypothetical protein
LERHNITENISAMMRVRPATARGRRPRETGKHARPATARDRQARETGDRARPATARDRRPRETGDRASAYKESKRSRGRQRENVVRSNPKIVLALVLGRLSCCLDRFGVRVVLCSQQAMFKKMFFKHRTCSVKSFGQLSKYHQREISFTRACSAVPSCIPEAINFFTV